MKDKRVSIIGAGFSGLAAAAVLAADGYGVEVFEKNAQVGGRARVMKSNGFVFDMGPSWYWMPDVFENFYERFGKWVSDFYELKKLSPSFRIFYGKDDVLDIPADENELFELFEQIEPGASQKLQEFLCDAKRKYEVAIKNKIVYKPSLSWTEYADLIFKKDAWTLQLLSTFHQHVRKYFRHPKLIQLMEFPVLFLGAMPKHTPALFSMMNYAGFSLGNFYPMGGMGKITEAMKKIAEENGAIIHTNAEVKKILSNGRKISSLIVNDEEIFADSFIASADYHHAENELLPKEYRMHDEKYWSTRIMSPSSLLFYVGVKKKLPNLLHHNLFFDESFEKHAEEIYGHQQFPSKPLFYLCCPSKTDDSVAPAGKENLFILIPLAAGLKDSETMREKYFRMVLDRIKTLTGNDFENEIEFKQSYCLDDFEKDYHAYKGNAYGMANTFFQTAFFRPRMQHKKMKNLFFAGQLTVPGPGVPPAIISGQIAAGLVKQFLN